MEKEQDIMRTKTAQQVQGYEFEIKPVTQNLDILRSTPLNSIVVAADPEYDDFAAQLDSQIQCFSICLNYKS